MNGEVARAGLTILFGALAGGLTNTLAIWMLFHPYQPPRILGRPLNRLQGAIPKNQARLAATIGRTVGTRLLTPADLASILAEPEFRAAFDERLRTFIDRALQQERGALLEILPAAFAAEINGFLADVTEKLLGRLDEYLESEEFRGTARRWTAMLGARLGEETLFGQFTSGTERLLDETVRALIDGILDSNTFETAVADVLDEVFDRLLAPDRTVQDLLPADLTPALEQAIASYLPVALERLDQLLLRPENRSRVQQAVHAVLDRFVRDLRFHQRLVAALIVTPETIDRILEAVEAEGAAKISEAIQDEEIQLTVANTLRQVISDLAQRPLAEIFQETGGPAIDAARAAVTNRILALARSPQIRSLLTGHFRARLSAGKQITLNDLFRHVPPERFAEALVEAARSEEARRLYREAAARTVSLLMARPLGRPMDYLPSDTAARLEAALADPLWHWLHEQIPPIAQRVEIARRVEMKILDYPVPRLEELIRSVTARELRLIILLGYVLGGAIGLVLVTLQHFIP